MVDRAAGKPSVAVVPPRNPQAVGRHARADVARSTPPQQGETQDFLSGLYGGLASTRIPSVGVDVTGTPRSPLPIFRRRGLSTVEGVDGAAGRAALVFLLGGARPGSYGIGADAVDGVLPDAPPAPTKTEE